MATENTIIENPPINSAGNAPAAEIIANPPKKGNASSKRADLPTTTEELPKETSSTGTSAVIPMEDAEIDANKASAPFTNQDVGKSLFKGNAIAEPPKFQETVSRDLNGGDRVVIRVTQLEKCKIGPKFWVFQPGQTYSVPENVKKILLRKGVLAVI